MGRIEEEIATVRRMIEIYCRHKEGNRELCGECRRLMDYAESRLRYCPHGEAKGTCRQCAIHCYRPDMKESIRKVMRYSGPRMIVYSPGAAFVHIYRETLHRIKGKLKSR